MTLNVGTKEDNEVWITERTEDLKDPLPRKLVPREIGVKHYIDHLRDFFVTITTGDTQEKSYKIATMQDGETEW